MKILYGIQGTGNGHTTRARVMAKALAAKGIDVDYVFSGRPADQYFDMDRFGDYRTFKGLTFVHEHGTVNFYQTAKQAKIWQVYKDVKSLDVSQYDLILNDFEPVSAWAGRLAGKTVINISHQAVFTNNSVPSKGLGWLNRQILKHFAPADIALGVHWFHFGQIIIPPFIEREIDITESTDDVLVYMPFEDVEDIVELLRSQHNRRFVVYHPDVTVESDEMGIALRKPCRVGFLQELERCAGVIANAGFELSSEALCVGKKLLLKPLDGQFEQASNAETLSQLGLATVMTGLDEAELERWLGLSNNDAINYPSDPAPLVDWIIEGDYRDPEALCQKLWKPISLPQFSANIVGEKSKPVELA